MNIGIKMKTIILVFAILLLTVPTISGEPIFFSVIEGNTSKDTSVEYEPNDFFYATGLLIPEHLQNSHYAVEIVTSELPSKWDWRTQDGVTSVKDQGNCGACYAFGSVGMIESYIKVNDGIPYDLSEEQGKNCMWETTGCLGGSVQWTMNPFTANGIITEGDYPYVQTSGICKDIEPTLRITEWNLLSTDKELSRDTLKSYIKKAPVVTSLVVEGWNQTYNGSYVLSIDKEGKPHAVVLVGWNDSTYEINVSGHWIFKNSWGTSWGDNGYGYIEYDTAGIGTHVSVIDGYEYYNPDLYTLNYDEAGWTLAFGAVSFDTIRGMAIYNLTNEDVEGIEFWTTGATSNIDLYLYDGWEGEKVRRKDYYLGNLTNELFSIKGLSYKEPGYHSIKIDPVNSSTGTIVVVADVTNIDSIYATNCVAPIAIDNKGQTEKKKTFVSVGDPKSKWYNWWYDASSLRLIDGTVGNADVALRLRVHGSEQIQCENILIETEGYVRTANIGNRVNFTVKCIDEYGMPTALTNITWHNSNDTVGTMTDSVFKAISTGATTIHAEGACKNPESNNITITVYKSSKNYLTDEEFRLRVKDLQDQINDTDTQNTNELQEIMDLLNNSDGSRTIVRMPNDAVSSDTFNEMMDALEKQINDMKVKSTSLYQRIINLIKELLN